MSGWICLHRSTAKHWIYQESDALKIWITMLIDANHDTSKSLFNGSLITVSRGQFVFGRKVYAAKTGVSENKIRRYLDLMEKDSMIHQQKTNRYSLITVLNYAAYQDKHQPTTSQPPAEHQPPTTSKQLNNDNNVDKKRGGFTKPTLAQLIAEFGNRVPDPEQQANTFLNYYESNGWMVGKSKMKSWTHTVTNWIARGNSNATRQPTARQTRGERFKDAERNYIARIEAASEGDDSAVEEPDFLRLGP